MPDPQNPSGSVFFETEPLPSNANRSVEFEAGPGVEHRRPRPEPDLIQVAGPRAVYGEGDEVPTGPMTNPNMQAQAARMRRNRPQARELEAEKAPTLIDLPQARYPSSALYWSLPLADDEGRRNLLQRHIPEATFPRDRFGNQMIETGGRRYHMDRPDTFNPQNLLYNARKIGMAVPAGLIAGALTPAALGTAGVAAFQGLGGAASNLISQVIPNYFGSGQRVEAAPALTEAALSAGGPFIPGAIRNLLTSKEPYSALPRGVRGQFERNADRIFPGHPSANTQEPREVALRIAAGTPGPSTQEIAEATLQNRAQNPINTPPGTTYRFNIDDPLAGNNEASLPPTLQRLLGPRQNVGTTVNGPRVSSLPQNLLEATGSRPNAGMLLDDPRLEQRAIHVVGSDTPGGREIVHAIEQREAGRAGRIAHDVDNSFGHLTANERQANQAFQQANQGFGTELRTVFSNASSVDPTPVLNRIDALLKKIPQELPEHNILNRIRNGLYSKDSAGNQVLVSDPEVLHNLRRYVDRLPKYGDPTAGVTPGSISSSDYNYRQVRNSLSDFLKTNVPGYVDVMNKYSGNYAAIDAFEHGLNLFSRTGPNAIHPSQASILLADPETSEAFRLGARNAIENRLRTSPNDLRALASMPAGEGDFIRENLVNIFGQENIDRILRTAAREGAYQQTAQKILAAAESGMRGGAAQEALSLRTPTSIDLSSIAFPARQIPAGLLQQGANSVLNRIRGSNSPEYYQGMARLLTSGGPEADEYLRGLERSLAFNRQNRRAAPFISSAAGSARPFEAAEEEDRPTRASGGRITSHHRAKAQALINAADRAKKAHNGNTKPILDMPDETVAKALSLADQAI